MHFKLSLLHDLHRVLIAFILNRINMHCSTIRQRRLFCECNLCCSIYDIAWCVLTRGKPGPVKLSIKTLLCCVLGTHTLYRIKLLSWIELILRERHRSLLHPHYFPITFDRWISEDSLPKQTKKRTNNAKSTHKSSDTFTAVPAAVLS